MALTQVLKTIAPRRLFLVDGLGALLSAFLLGVVLVRFESSFGVPAGVLYMLAAIAAGFSLYSVSCSIFDFKHWRVCLRLIAGANLAYCCLTIGMVIYLHRELSLLGVSYFAGEVAVVVALATAELKTASR